MRLTLFTLLLGTLLAARAAEQRDSSTDYLPALPPEKHWELAWSDEFNGTTLDTNKWEAIGDSKRRDGYWRKEDSYLDGNGLCVLRTKKDGDHHSSGAIRTLGKFEHRFGYWVARMKLPKQPGHWPAFWLMCPGVNSVGNEGRDGTEIDIVEVPWRDGTITYNLHWDGYGQEHKSAGSQTKMPELPEGFHTYSLYWTPSEYVIYVDGKEVWRSSAGGVSQVPEYIKLTEEIGPWGGDIKKAALPDYCYVDYVRVYDVADGKGTSDAGNPVAQQTVIRRVSPSVSQTNASLVINTREHSATTIPKFITGKFCEHLRNNIYNGMDAQILRNPTMADYPFWSGQASPDGVGNFLFNGEQIKRELRRQAGRTPMDTALGLVEGYSPGLVRLACRAGARDSFEQGQEDLHSYGSIDLPARQIHRLVNRVGPAMRKQLERPRPPLESAPSIPTLYVSVDGTGVPMVAEELEGRSGKQADGSAKTREVKLGCVFTQTCQASDQLPLRDPQSTTSVAGFEVAADFGLKVRQEALSRGMARAKTVVYLGDGAHWIWELARVNFPFAIMILDLFHALEHLQTLTDLLHGEKTPASKALWEQWRLELLGDQVVAVIQKARQQAASMPEAQQKLALSQIGYMENNQTRML